MPNEPIRESVPVDPAIQQQVAEVLRKRGFPEYQDDARAAADTCPLCGSKPRPQYCTGQPAPNNPISEAACSSLDCGLPCRLWGKIRSLQLALVDHEGDATAYAKQLAAAQQQVEAMRFVIDAARGKLDYLANRYGGEGVDAPIANRLAEIDKLLEALSAPALVAAEPPDHAHRAVTNALRALSALSELTQADPKKCGGKLLLKGQRFSIAQLIAELAEEGTSVKSVCDNLDLDANQVHEVLHALASSLAAPVAAEPQQGSSVKRFGPVAIACMDSQARELMDLALAQYAAHKGVGVDELSCDAPWDTPSIYSFAYWLFRYSGLLWPEEQQKGGEHVTG